MEIIGGVDDTEEDEQDRMRYPKPYENYLIVDPETLQIALDREGLVRYAAKLFESLFGIKPEESFWCYGYDIAYAGPLPEVRKP